VKALLEGTIPHPGQVVMEGPQPVDGIEQMLVTDPYWLKMYLEMMWNNGAALIDTPTRRRGKNNSAIQGIGSGRRYRPYTPAIGTTTATNEIIGTIGAENCDIHATEHLVAKVCVGRPRRSSQQLQARMHSAR
jgi:hypothetical protein